MSGSVLRLTPELQPFVERNGFPFESLTALADEGSSRRYWRATSGQRSAILCLDHPFQTETSDFVQLSRYLQAQKASVPAIIDLDERGWFLLEDAGRESLADLCSRDAEAGRIAYMAAIEELARWQMLSPPQIVARRYFDFDKLWWEMEFLFARLDLLSDMLHRNVRPSFELQTFLRSVCESLGSGEPKVFAHRDLHARNIMIPDSSRPNRVVFIDFQDARMGLPYYDLSSLLYDPYSDLSRAERKQYLEHYRSVTGRSTGNRYYLQAMQRIFKALGSYLFLTFEKQKYFYVHSIEPALQRLEEIILLGHFPDCAYLFVKDMRNLHLPYFKDLAKRMAEDR